MAQEEELKVEVTPEETARLEAIAAKGRVADVGTAEEEAAKKAAADAATAEAAKKAEEEKAAEDAAKKAAEDADKT